MHNHEVLLIIFVFSILLNFLFKKITFLCDRKIHSKHKNFIENYENETSPKMKHLENYEIIVNHGF